MRSCCLNFTCYKGYQILTFSVGDVVCALLPEETALVIQWQVEIIVIVDVSKLAVMSTFGLVGCGVLL